MIKIEFPDGSRKEFEAGITGKEIAESIGQGLAKAALAVKVNGTTTDLTTPINEDSKIEILTFKQEEGKKIFWHTSSHVLMHALTRLYKAIPSIGPAIENGFYHDFDCEKNISQEDLSKIEVEMQKIVDEDIKIEKKVLPVAKAIKLLKDKGFKYTAELAEELKKEGEKEVTLYEEGDFINMCKGPHAPSTGYIKAFKLTKISGVYWKGDSNKEQLQRIYGVSFPDKKELKKHLQKIKEAEASDHNKIGRELEFFTTHEYVGQGLPLMMPKGAEVLKTLQRWIEDEEAKRGYVLTKTPYLAKSDLYKVSGHWEHYRDGMFLMNSKGEEMALRPMTCPFQFIIYKSKQHSYKELPIRYNETSVLFRNEESGEMHGLTRVRQFTLSEGHIICRPDQLEEEFKGALELIKYVMKTLGIEKDIWYRFSKWDPENKKGKYIDNPEAWEASQKAMKKILDDLKLEYDEAEGEAAFYGPKLDLQTKNVYGKEDTLITIQIDFALPERFDLFYVDKESKKKRPMVIHRSSIGCYERTLAMLIEKYKGAFPLWLNPNQVIILPVADRFKDYAEMVAKSFRESGIKVDIDDRTETISKKVRDAEINKWNFILVVGEKEVKDNTVTVRTRDNKVEGAVDYKEFQKRIIKEIKDKV